MKPNRFIKKCPCFYFQILFSSQKVILETLFNVQKDELIYLYVCCQLSIFSHLIHQNMHFKGILYQMNSTFRNTVFNISCCSFNILLLTLLLYPAALSWLQYQDHVSWQSREGLCQKFSYLHIFLNDLHLGHSHVTYVTFRRIFLRENHPKI